MYCHWGFCIVGKGKDRSLAFLPLLIAQFWVFLTNLLVFTVRYWNFSRIHNKLILGMQQHFVPTRKNTLEIYSEFSSNFPLRIHKSRSIQWLMRYSTFNIMRSSSIGGSLQLVVIFQWRSSSFWGFKQYGLVI